MEIQSQMTPYSLSVKDASRHFGKGKKEMGLFKHFSSRNIAYTTIHGEISIAIEDAWNRWGENGDELVSEYEPFVGDTTLDLVERILRQKAE
jgi:hypothetical protein